MALILADNLTYTYQGSSKPAIAGISLSVEAGEYIAIVGANGSGKSTLARHFDGLLKTDSGRVLVNGLDAADVRNAHAVRSTVSLVFQCPTDQIVASVVEEEVAFGPENLALPREEIARRVSSSLAAAGLESERLRSPRFLSGGQQQRLAIAGALAMGSECLVFDEATAMIDPEGRTEVIRLIDSLVSSGKAVIHVTHDMDEAARAVRVIALVGGRVAFDGSSADFFSGDLPERLGLGYTSAGTLASAFGPDRIGPQDAETLAKALYDLLRGRAAEGREHAVKPSAASAVASNTAFSLRNVTKSYLRGTFNERFALSAESLEIPEGSMVAFVGATGSGKTTALQLLDAISFPDEGQVLSFGRDTSDKRSDLKSIRMRAPLAVQRPESALFERFAGDDVAFGPRNQGLTGKDLVARTETAMNAAGLDFSSYRDRQTRTLSGGEKRKLALAGVIAMDAPAVLLDEPCSGLDPASRSSIMELLARLKREGKTIVYATHSMEEAAMSDFVAVFRDGRIASYGAPGEIFGDRFDPDWGIARPFAAEIYARAAELRIGRLPSGSDWPLDARAFAMLVDTAKEGACPRESGS